MASRLASAESELLETTSILSPPSEQWWWIRLRKALALASYPVALLLLVSGVTHLANPYQFLQSIYAYELVNDWVGIALAAVLPFLHLVLGLVLLMPGTNLRRPALAISAALFLIYALAQGAALQRGLKISCGCFSSLQSSPIGVRSIAIAATACLLSTLGLVASPASNPPHG